LIASFIADHASAPGRVEVSLNDGKPVLAQVSDHRGGRAEPGTSVRVGVRMTPLLALPADTIAEPPGRMSTNRADRPDFRR
jgi:hypothetical protein